MIWRRRDRVHPEGTLVLMYTPVTEAAKLRFGGR